MAAVKASTSLISIPHGLCGRRSNNRLSENATGHLQSFFASMKDHGSPRATRLVRIIAAQGAPTKIEMRDQGVDLIELSPFYNKSNMHKRFCHSRGYDPIFDAKHRLIEMRNLPDVADEDRVPVKEVPSYPTFINYWKSFFPKDSHPTSQGGRLCVRQ